MSAGGKDIAFDVEAEMMGFGVKFDGAKSGSENERKATYMCQAGHNTHITRGSKLCRSYTANFWRSYLSGLVESSLGRLVGVAGSKSPCLVGESKER